MKFEHHVLTEASRQDLWTVLQDFPRVAHCLPGVSEVQQLDSGAYQGTMGIRIGPMGVNLSGTVILNQDEKNGQWSIRAHAQDTRSGGGVNATIKATITKELGNTAGLIITANVQFMGRLGELGQPLIKHRADSIILEFSKNLKQCVIARDHY